jgi:hypothetical protein
VENYSNNLLTYDRRPSNSIITLDIKNLQKSEKFMGKKRKRIPSQEEILISDNNFENVDSYFQTLAEFSEEFESIGLDVKTPHNNNIIKNKSYFNSTLCDSFEKIFNSIKTENDKPSKLVENYLISNVDILNNNNSKDIFEKIKKISNSKNNNNEKLSITKLLQFYSNLEINDDLSQIFDLFKKVLNYYEKQEKQKAKNNKLKYELEIVNWKDVKNKAYKNNTSHKDYLIQKIKDNDKPSVIDSDILKSLIYLTSKKNLKFDKQLKLALETCLSGLGNIYTNKTRLSRKIIQNSFKRLSQADESEIFRYIVCILQSKASGFSGDAYLLNKFNTKPEIEAKSEITINGKGQGRRNEPKLQQSISHEENSIVSGSKNIIKIDTEVINSRLTELNQLTPVKVCNSNNNFIDQNKAIPRREFDIKSSIKASESKNISNIPIAEPNKIPKPKIAKEVNNICPNLEYTSGSSGSAPVNNNSTQYISTTNSKNKDTINKNVLLNFNVNLNFNLNVNVSTKEKQEKPNTIIKIDVEALKNKLADDDQVTITESSSESVERLKDDEITISDISYSKEVKKVQKIFLVSKNPKLQNEKKLKPIQNINFEIKPVKKTENKAKSIKNNVISNFNLNNLPETIENVKNFTIDAIQEMFKNNEDAEK